MNKVGKGFIATTVVLGVLGITTAVVLPVILNKTKKQPEVEAKDQKQVDTLNNVLKQTDGFDTMSEMVLYLSTTKNIDLEALNASDNTQYVWGQEKNVVFTIDTNGNAVAKPSGYTINQKKNNIWKMVNLSSSNGKIESFVQHSEYGQYLRLNSSIPTQISFSSNIDTGFNPNLKLKYEKPESISYIPKVVTYRSDLVIDGTIGDIDHYGHAKSIAVTDLGDGGTYNEYGIVDGNITLKKGIFVGKPSCDINTIVVASDKVQSIKLEKDETTSEPAIVGSIIKTTDVTKIVSSLVDDEAIPSESKPDKDIKYDPEKVGKFAGGLGTIKSPYVISNAEQLINCSTEVNSAGLSTNNTLHFALDNDIDMTGKTFTPIGTQTNKFFGTFNGWGYTINGLKISDTCSSKTHGFGLFGWVDGTKNVSFNELDDGWDSEKKKINEDNLSIEKYKTVIQNIVLDNVDIQIGGDSRSVGGIVGVAANAYIRNCQVKSGTIKGNKGVAGISGSVNGSICDNCIIGNDDVNANRLDVIANVYNVAGIVGVGDYIGSGTCNAIINCSTKNNSTISCNDNVGGYIGGMISYCDMVETMIIDHCTNNAEIISKSDNPEDSGIAGIAGYAVHTDVVANCINNGSIRAYRKTANENEPAIAQAAGITSKTEGVFVYNCINNGSVKANASVGVAGVAIGYIPNRSYSIEGCSNTSTELENPYDPSLLWNVCDYPNYPN